MASVDITRRLVNPGVRKRRKGVSVATRKRLTLKQKLFFGTPAQRSAAKLALKGAKRRKKRTANPSRKRRVTRKRTTVKRVIRRRRRARAVNPARRRRRVSRVSTTRKRRVTRKRVHRRRRVRNVGQILTYTLGNPGGRKRKKRSTKTVARRKRRATTKRRVHRRRRSNPSLRSLLGMTRRKRRYSRRRKGNPGMRRRYHRRRNPGVISGAGTSVLGVIGGAALTKFLVERAVPAQFSAGMMGYISTAIVAYLQGYLVSRFAHKAALGSAMQLGGWTYLGLRILNDFGFGGYSALGLKGALARSSFYTPQINMPNSLTTFVRPDMVPAPAMRGRTGRIS